MSSPSFVLYTSRTVDGRIFESERSWRSRAIYATAIGLLADRRRELTAHNTHNTPPPPQIIMDLSTSRSMEHEPDAPLKQGDQTPPPTFLTRDGTLTRLRPEVDVVLSLKNPTYKAVMLGYFQKLGDKKKSADKNNEEERKIAKEVLTLFKGRKKGEVARFFKPEARYSNRCFTEVDDKYALDSECCRSCCLVFFI